MSNSYSVPTKVSLSDQISFMSEMLSGILEVMSSNGAGLDPKVVEQMNQLTGTLKNLSKAAAEKEDERKNLRALTDISKLINSSLEIDEVLKIAMDTIIRLSGAERGFLMLRDDQGELQIRVARNWEEESIDPSEFAISHTVINRVEENGEPVITTDAQEDERFGEQASVIYNNLRSILCVPLKVKDVITGVIYADNRIQSGIFTEKERDLLFAFADQAAIALENARLFESVRQTLAEVTQLKNLMDNVFSSIASGVITADVDRKIILFNKAAQRILDIHDVEMVGHSFQESLSPIADQINEHVLNAMTRDLLVTGQETTIDLPSRGNVDLSFNISPLKDDRKTTQGVAIVLDDLTEKNCLQARYRMFERMVSPGVINKLDPDEMRLGGERAEITSLFADIRGFTSFSESLDPQELVSVLNQYLSVVADAILEQEGTIDKFLGDAVMAWFNAPIPQPDHMKRAVRSAINMRDAIQKLNNEMPENKRLAFGVGIHFGEVVLGLVGTDARLEYTAIGDSVNTAKRIQENSKPNQILISGPAYELAKDWIEVVQVEPIKAKGKSHPVAVYEVVGLNDLGRA